MGTKQSIPQVVQKLTWKGVDALYDILEDGRDFVLQVGLLDTGRGWGDLLSVLHGSQLDLLRPVLASSTSKRGGAACWDRS